MFLSALNAKKGPSKAIGELTKGTDLDDKPQVAPGSRRSRKRRCPRPGCRTEALI